MTFLDDTICAPASGQGGAIAVIRISGPDTLRIVDRVVEFRHGNASSSEGYRIKFGVIKDIDEVLVSLFRSPASYTGEDSAEINCHASEYIVSSILERLTSEGCRLAGPGEFTRRAFVAGKMDLAQAEAVADVIASTSEAEHRVAMSQMKGAYSAELRALRDKLVELSALLELELDFSEEEVEFVDRKLLEELCAQAASKCTALADSFKMGNALKCGIPVAIAGEPNSGKSTLLNALLGDSRAIVSDVPGTTRDTVEEIFVIDGVKFRLIDTAGLRESSDIVEKMGIERSREAIGRAHIILFVHDVSRPVSGPDLDLSSEQTLIHVDNKTDLLKSGTCRKECPSEGIRIPLSALTGDGLPELKKALVDAAAGQRHDANRSILVTNARHAAALKSASQSLKAVLSGLVDKLPGDLIAEDLRSSIASINTILGDAITPDTVLGEIFGRFCIGK
ncbi:MAG: tRNA uridine-5-carboxymethylaminomethyl(34) synthesis GTPase MnmE [Bacteroidales bacterium]|nr:tRNA uridine-5-carboxymethylaminomethyl(34) synthesis GTPase MnmE [Bacteroidales bacterium]